MNFLENIYLCDASIKKMSTSLYMLNAECKHTRSQFLMQTFLMCELPKEWLLTPHFSVRRLSGLQYSQTRARITSCIAKSNHEGCYKCPRNITAQTGGGSVRLIWKEQHLNFCYKTSVKHGVPETVPQTQSS